MRTLRYIVAPGDGPPKPIEIPMCVSAQHRVEPEGNLTPPSKAESPPLGKPGHHDAPSLAEVLGSAAKLATAQFDRAPNLRTERVARLTLHAYTAQRRAMRAHTDSKKKGGYRD